MLSAHPPEFLIQKEALKCQTMAMPFPHPPTHYELINPLFLFLKPQYPQKPMGFKPQPPPKKMTPFSTTSPTIRISTVLSLTLFFASFLLFIRLSNFARSQQPHQTDCRDDRGYQVQGWSGDLRDSRFAWNKLCFGPPVNPRRLRLAVFSKKWPVGAAPGGMERHAFTLYSTLASRGHEIHVFTVPSDPSRSESGLPDGALRLHFAPNEAGLLNNSLAWELFASENESRAFDFVHTESVALPHWRARRVANLAASWHGVGYEALHSTLVQDLLHGERAPRSPEAERHLHDVMPRLIQEIRFFSSYAHHICISDSAGEILRSVYQLPNRRVHVILNGVDQKSFRHDPEMGLRFRREFGLPQNASLVMGVAGRLVKDKGHPLLFEAFSEIRERHPGVFLLIAGSGPWESRYRDLQPNVKVLGALDPERLAEFYNSLDVFVNPTLRQQGLDLTLMEAMQCAKAVVATDFPSIKGSVVVSEGMGYTFAPNVGALVEALEEVIKDGHEVWRAKGMASRAYASSMFAAEKMATAYERFFLCMNDRHYCRYPLPTDC
ncbi:uncharacterized protein LOC18442204 [Amborella trichopoda]|nr:uncharacterized protein LOC18442204 [Amborella trichopoda]|eukprot:XP_006852489.2 uncharacterized protein LOC18442204 [Amborella trichopoda]